VREGRRYRRVTRLYGDWPTFAGGQVKSVRLRSLGTHLDLTIHYWRGAESLERYDGPRPYNPEDRHRLIRLSFCDAENIQVVGFDHESVVDEVRIDPGVPMRVTVNPGRSHGLRIEFTALEAWVSRIVQCDQYGRVVRAEPGAAADPAS
jgi:hypothetical protein